MGSHQEQPRSCRLRQNGCCRFYVGGGGFVDGCCGSSSSFMSLIVDFVVVLVVMMAMVSTCDAADPCTDAIVVDDMWRDVSATYVATTIQCDKDVFSTDKWYTFKIGGLSASIPTNCIKNDMCGAKIGMRVNLEGQSLPVQPGDNITAIACGSSNILGKYDCCVLGTKVIIARCDSGALIYQFSSSFIDRCPVAVCAQKAGDLLPPEVTAKTGERHPDSPVTEDTTEEATTLQDTSSILMDSSSDVMATTPGAGEIDTLAAADSQDITDEGEEATEPLTETTAASKYLTTLADVTEAVDADLGIFGPVALVEINTTPGQLDGESDTTADSDSQADSSTDTATASSLSVPPPGADSHTGNETATDFTDSSKDIQLSTESSADITVASGSELNTTVSPASTGDTSEPSRSIDGITTFLPAVPSASSASGSVTTAVVSTSVLSTVVSEDSHRSTVPSVTTEQISTTRQFPSPSERITYGDTTDKKIFVTTAPSTTSPTQPATTAATTKAVPTIEDLITSTPATDRTTVEKVTAGPQSTTAPPPTRRITTMAIRTQPSTPLSTALSSSATTITTPSTSVAWSNHTVTDIPAGPSEIEDFIMIERVRLVFKGIYEGDRFTNKVYGMMESFLTRATRQEKAKDGSDWWFKLSCTLQPITFKNTTTYLDFQIKHTAQMEIFYMFRRLHLQEFISQNSNLTLLTDCRPKQNCEEYSVEAEPLLGVFEKHAPVFVTVITLCSVCLGVIVLGMLFARCRRRGTWRASPDIEAKTLSDTQPYFNGNQSPFTDAQIMKDEVVDDTSFNGDAKDGDNDNNMDNNDNTWVIPLDDAVVAGQDGVVAKATEDTKL